MRLKDLKNCRSTSATPALANPAPDQPADPTTADPNVPTPNQPAPVVPVPNHPAPAGRVPNQPAVPAPQKIHQQILNWSHFKPQFTGRPEEAVEAHLLHTNDWMLTHNFQDDVKVQRFCLTLVGEARLWYESLTPIANNWPTLQQNFRNNIQR